MNKPVSASLAALLAASAFGAPLSITGMIKDKLGAGLPEAKVCLVSDPAQCVVSGPTGAFRFTTGTPIPIRTRAEIAGPKAEWRQGRLHLVAAERLVARVSWLDGAGRALAPARDMELAAGANPLAPPASARGLAFLRVDMQAASYTWKAALMGGQAGPAPAFATASAAYALSRSAAVAVNRDLSVAKAGFRKSYYRPAKDTVENVVIALAAHNDSGTLFSGESKAKVVSIDRAGKRVSVEAIGRKCDYEKLAWVPDTLRDTSSWAVRNGKLYLWEKGMCKGETYGGGATAIDPIGSWTLDEGAAWPSDLASAGCTEPAAELPSDAWRKRTLAVTHKEWMERTEFEACTGDLFMALVRFQMGGDSASTLIKNTCKEGAVKDKAGDIASLNYGLKGDSMAVTVRFKGKTCEGTKYFGPEQECPDTFMQPFMACLAGMGFAGPGREGAL